MDVDRTNGLFYQMSFQELIMDMDCFTFIGESEKWGTIDRHWEGCETKLGIKNELLEVLRPHSQKQTVK